MKLTVDDLSPDQREAYSSVRSWLASGSSGQQVLSLAGFAGTGKSTVVSVLAHELPSPLAFCAFTGKASSVLGRKLAASGIATTARAVRVDPLTGSKPFEPRPYCGTIHGLIYRPCEKCMQEDDGTAYDHTYGKGCKASIELKAEDPHYDAFQAAFAGKRDDGPCLRCDPPPPKARKDQGPCSRCGDARYLRRDELDRQYKLIVVDEASMVSDDILETLLRHGIPILAVGDHGQLPPVRGQGSLMKRPDLRLEQIHRQAAGSPIIGLSAAIRTRGDIDDRLEDGEAFTILPRRKLGDWIAEQFPKERLGLDPTTREGILGTVLVSWTNKLRVSLNYDVRDSLGLSESPPMKGEAVICLKNKPPVYNGMRAVLAEDSRPMGDGDRRKHAALLDFAEDGIRSKDRVLMSELQFFAEKTIDYDAATERGVRLSQIGDLYDFGYGLTCHKMQGSQASTVAVIVEPGLVRMGKDDRTRWLYTAVTRAADRLVIFR